MCGYDPEIEVDPTSKAVENLVEMISVSVKIVALAQHFRAEQAPLHPPPHVADAEGQRKPASPVRRTIQIDSRCARLDIQLEEEEERECLASTSTS